MTRVLRNICLLSLLLYLVSTGYTRFKDCHFPDCASKIVYSLPLDAFPLHYLEGKDRVLVQIGMLSKSEVIELFKTNPDQFPNCYVGTTLKVANLPVKDYVVLRFKNTAMWHSGSIKCYFSSFPHPIVHYISLPSQMTNYYNIVLPYPEYVEQDSSKPSSISVRWKHF